MGWLKHLFCKHEYYRIAKNIRVDGLYKEHLLHCHKCGKRINIKIYNIGKIKDMIKKYGHVV